MPFARERKPGPFDLDANGRLSLTALIRHLQEVADLHVEPLRLRLADVRRDGRQWLMTDFTVELDRAVEAGEPFVVETFVAAGGKGVRAPRDWRVRDAAGAEIGRAKSTWVLLDRESKRPVALAPGTFEPEEPVELRHPREAHAPLEPEARETGVTVGWADLDLNDHANHVRYFEWMIGTLPEEWVRGGQVRHFDIRFQREAPLGMTLRARASLDAGGVARHEMVDAAGQVYARGRSRWA